MRQSIKPLWAAAAALLAGACVTVGPDFTGPIPPEGTTATHYAMAADPIPAGVILAPGGEAGAPWWRAFNSAELDSYIQFALARSPSVEEAEAVLERSQAMLAAERGEALPQASLGLGARRTRINTTAFGFSGFPNRTLDLYSINGGVTYDLDLFGGRRRRIEAAAARVEADSARAEAARLALTGNLTLQLLRVAVLQAYLTEVRQLVENDRRIIDMIQEAQAAGGAARADLSTIVAQLAEDEALIPPVQRQLAAARHQVALLSGRAPAALTLPEIRLSAVSAPSDVPIAVPSELLRRRPDIRAAEAELHAATANIGVAAANQYPAVRLTADLTQTALRPDDLFGAQASGWNLASSLAAPLFDGGVLKARRQAAEAEARVAQARYEQTVLRAFVQVSDALAALAADQEGIASMLRAVAAAEIALQDAQSAQRLGAGPLIDVVRAQRTLSRARQALVQIQGQRLFDLVELYVAAAPDWRAS
jgi:NodT family efflux transporter outer membrane factor (OMF) lipoprotein